MRSKSVFVIAGLVLALTGPLPAAPQAAQAPAVKPAPAQAPAPVDLAERKAAPVFSYDPGNRRDPFKDLFGGKELKEARVISGIGDLMIDEVNVMGIVKAGGKFEAIAGFAEGFPLTLREGDRMADGYVLSVKDDRITFRKTKEKGVPLIRPKDIVKEITPEERSHE